MVARFSFFVGALAVLLGLLRFAAAGGNANVSTLYISDAQASVIINLDPDSDDVNFYVTAPTWYSYFAIGIGATMTNSLMLVVYSAADGQSITVSPRLSTGETEPPYYPGANITQADGSSIQGGFFEVTGTCQGCRSWPGGSLDTNTTVQPFIFALGSNIGLASNDLAAPLKKHIGYGRFTVNTIQATGAGGVGLIENTNPNVTTGASIIGDIQNDSDSASFSHGIIMVIATLIVAPVDMVAAGLLRRWPILHIVTATFFLAFVLGGMGPGIVISREYIRTQKFQTGHQILGFVTIGIMGAMAVLGTLYRLLVRAAAGRQQEPPERSGLLHNTHAWGGRIVWLLLLLNNGLGLQLAFSSQTFIISYSVLAVGLFIVMIITQLCLFVCFRKRPGQDKEEEETAHQLAQFYGEH